MRSGMKGTATYFHGYEQYEGQLEVTPAGVSFAKKKTNRAGTFAAFGLLGLMFTSKYEKLLEIPRADVTAVGATPDGQRLQLLTRNGPMIFAVGNVNEWLAYMTSPA
jgi:hypothetical protein